VNARAAGAELPAGPVVSTAWLEDHLDSPDLRVVDVRGQVLPPGSVPRYVAKRADYDAAHVPGARFLDWTRDIIDVSDPIPVQVAPPGAFAAAMEDSGIGDGTVVVAYDDYHHIFAGRLAWALRYYGHDTVFLLDGGWSRWVAEKRPVTAQIPDRVFASFTPQRRPSLRRDADDVSRTLGRPEVLLVDARAPEQYEGRASVARRGGHIPGARNLHYPQLFDAETGRFLSTDGLVRAFSDAGIDVARLPSEVVVYCNSGVSCTALLNAFRLLGRDDVAVYDGSWNEWGNDASRPVTAGSAP
jgi:thiosulfate/3-mercaptopyruvate sulfurtransferase